MSPSFAIDRFNRVINTFGHLKAATGLFKREREAWISAVWALGIRTITAREYWIEIETKDRTPDCKVHYISNAKDRNHVDTFNVEVVEWDEHVDKITTILERKCKKAYPPSFFLVLLARNGDMFNTISLCQEIQSWKIPFAEIWVLGRPSPVNDKYRMFLAHPDTKLVDVDVSVCLRQDKRKVQILKRLKRSKRNEFVDLGAIYLPIPID